MSFLEHPSSTEVTSAQLTGTVTAVQANFYQVYLDSESVSPLEGLPILLCTRRTRLKKLVRR